MSITSIVAAFQTANAGITGVTSAPTARPGSLTSDKLPCAITDPGPGIWHSAGMGGKRYCSRSYLIKVYVVEASPEAAQVQKAFEDMYTLLERFGAHYRSISSVGGAPIVRGDAGALDDTGVVATLMYAGQEFFGFQLRVPILEQT